MLHVVSLQTAGRLVHEDDPRLRGNRATDLDHLLRGQRQLADEAVRSKVRMGEALKDVEGELLGFAALKEAPSRGFATEQDVLGDREMRAERQLLMDEGDAGPARVVRRGRSMASRQAPCARCPAAVRPPGRSSACLAGAVLADQGVDLSRIKGERDSIQRNGRPEALVNAFEFEERCHGRRLIRYAGVCRVNAASGSDTPARRPALLRPRYRFQSSAMTSATGFDKTPRPSTSTRQHRRPSERPAACARSQLLAVCRWRSHHRARA